MMSRLPNDPFCGERLGSRSNTTGCFGLWPKLQRNEAIATRRARRRNREWSKVEQKVRWEIVRYAHAQGRSDQPGCKVVTQHRVYN